VHTLVFDILKPIFKVRRWLCGNVDPAMSFKVKKFTPDFLVFYEPYIKIIAGFVGMWESRRLFQVIVGSVGKSQDFSMLSTMTAFPQSFV